MRYINDFYDFLHVDTWSQKLKNACGQSGHGTQKWTDRIKSVFSCWFRKATSWFSYFWVGVVKNGHGFLVCETLICYTLGMNLWIELSFWMWCNNFWWCSTLRLILLFKCRRSVAVVLLVKLSFLHGIHFVGTQNLPEN